MKQIKLVTILITVFLGVSVHNAQAKPTNPSDSTIYTTYSSSPSDVYWVTCGSTLQDSGCYGSGSLPENYPCAMLEDTRRVTHATSTEYDSQRNVYVITSGDKKTSPGLSVYLMKYQVTPNYVTTTYTLVKQVALSNLVGGTGVQCFAAANSAALYIGTSKSDNAVMVSKSGYATSSIGGFSPAIPVSSISANNEGYVTVNFGGKQGTGFYTFGPSGSSVEDGGGNEYVPNTFNAIPLK